MIFRAVQAWRFISMVGSKALKILLKKLWDVPVWTLLMSHDKHWCPGTSQGRPRFLSRIFPTFGTNHEYESSWLYGPKYQSSKFLSFRILISYFFFDNFWLFHFCPTSELFAALKIGKYLVRPRLKSHKDISSKPETRQRRPSFQNGKIFQSEKKFFLNFFFLYVFWLFNPYMTC